ncbi:tetra-peptide repeat homeobox protein 1-like [Melanotaenia boesemani]|uniref:tetra-peptide repeat homeobox protein 1-like n=1 Tax=Melanotaenia boesemani TaxID=1250792 RepID=UPI001C05B4BD|nr:tetra-peptide repeat homeobox protein 1-like [Melanotaenia boesemani]
MTLVRSNSECVFASQHIQLIPPSKTTQRNQPGPEPGPGPGPRPKPIPRLIYGPGHEVRPKGEPEPSCVSMNSDQSRDYLIDFQQNHGSVKQIAQRLECGPGPGSGLGPRPALKPKPRLISGPTPGPQPSCVSMNRDLSKGCLIDFHQSRGSIRQ